jgi:hypothetical protein
LVFRVVTVLVPLNSFNLFGTTTVDTIADLVLDDGLVDGVDVTHYPSPTHYEQQESTSQGAWLLPWEGSV